MRPVSIWFAASGLEQATLSMAVAWLGDLLSGHLHQEAAVIELAGRSFSISILHRCSSDDGSKGPLQGDESEDYCIGSWAYTHFGVELVHKEVIFVYHVHER